MAIYRADQKHGVAWITGGSTGIGRQLALDLAREGYTVAVTSREEDPIEPVIEAAAGLPGKILPFYCDVTDEPGMAATVEAIESRGRPDHARGLQCRHLPPGARRSAEPGEFPQDLRGQHLRRAERPHPGRRAACRSAAAAMSCLIGSVTSYFGWPTLAAYGATKAALNNMADALRYDFDKMNIRIQVINPGFVDTPLAAKNTHLMP